VAGGETKVVISRADRRLYLYKDGQLARTFKVGVGKHRGSTPAGKFHIIGKAHDPVWSYKGKHVPGGIAANPLGHWWMGLSVTHKTGTRFGIHGTNAPWSIGGNVSRGCIRMHNRDAARLFRAVGPGTPVIIR
jgi:lipoprotein-anchoring transpeptidase ErfK/SrfK